MRVSSCLLLFLSLFFELNSPLSSLSQVVNALLTQLDKLKNRKNVLIMTTSNIAQAIGSSRFFLRVFATRLL